MEVTLSGRARAGPLSFRGRRVLEASVRMSGCIAAFMDDTFRRFSLQNIGVEWLVFMFHIREVASSYLDSETDYPD
jgi:hypothetical protein